MTSKQSLARAPSLRIVTLALAAAALLPACAPLVIGGAMVGGSLMVTDRRTSGTQVEDQAIELKAAGKVRETVGDRANVSVTSFNRVVLITGEVPTDADRNAVEQAVVRVEQVKSVVNELGVLGNSSSSMSDGIITGRVKAAFVDAKDLQANAYKVVTQRAVVYLMGRVTEREAARATDIARGQSGVLKVVRVFEIVTEAELADLQPKAPTK